MFSPTSPRNVGPVRLVLMYECWQNFLKQKLYMNCSKRFCDRNGTVIPRNCLCIQVCQVKFRFDEVLARTTVLPLLTGSGKSHFKFSEPWLVLLEQMTHQASGTIPILSHWFFWLLVLLAVKTKTTAFNPLFCFSNSTFSVQKTSFSFSISAL